MKYLSCSSDQTETAGKGNVGEHQSHMEGSARWKHLLQERKEQHTSLTLCSTKHA